ncbi:hypothetical protein RSAG8_12224, partial [Rhizoctonia solani AG-8 WAC10335]
MTRQPSTSGTNTSQRYYIISSNAYPSHYCPSRVSTISISLHRAAPRNLLLDGHASTVRHNCTQTNDILR